VDVPAALPDVYPSPFDPDASEDSTADMAANQSPSLGRGSDVKEGNFRVSGEINTSGFL